MGQSEIEAYLNHLASKRNVSASTQSGALNAIAFLYRAVLLEEMPEPDQCCGMGGSFNLQYYEISKKIGQNKAAHIQATGADVLATGCPACMIQISDMLSQAGAKIAVRHPVELVADALDP